MVKEVVLTRSVALWSFINTSHSSLFKRCTSDCLLFFQNYRAPIQAWAEQSEYVRTSCAFFPENVSYFIAIWFVLQVDVMKNAYNQGLECDHEEENGDDGISPKDVGHNIYILAHQVFRICCTIASRRALHA